MHARNESFTARTGSLAAKSVEKDYTGQNTENIVQDDVAQGDDEAAGKSNRKNRNLTARKESSTATIVHDDTAHSDAATCDAATCDVATCDEEAGYVQPGRPAAHRSLKKYDHTHSPDVIGLIHYTGNPKYAKGNAQGTGRKSPNIIHNDEAACVTPQGRSAAYRDRQISAFP